MSIKNRLLFLSLSLCIFLGACKPGESFHDLREYINKLEQTTSTTKTIDTSIISQPKSISYQKEIARTPFEELTSVQGAATGTKSSNPLNAYPLNLLRFVGTVKQNNQVWAYVVTPDNKIYQVTMGDRIGNRGGKIRKISHGQVEVLEPLEEGKLGAGRIVTLQLKEEGS